LERGSPEVWFDLRTCTPTSPSNCKRAAAEPGFAARRGNELKDNDWAEIAAAQGARFIPLTFETFGRAGQQAVAFIETMSTYAGACPIERSAFVRNTSQRLYTSNMRAVANLLLKNAPFSPGHCLLPLTMVVAPLRRPAAAPLVFPTAPRAAADGTQVEDLPEGTPRGQPAWLTHFLSGDEQDQPTARPTPAFTPIPPTPPFALGAIAAATITGIEAGAFSPFHLPLRAPCC